MNIKAFFAFTTFMFMATIAIMPASGDVIATGDVVGNPTTSTFADNLRIGDTASGQMTVNANGSDHDVFSSGGQIGWAPGSSGNVLIEGSGSSWSNKDNLYIANQGNGTLNIRHGATVLNTASHIARSAGTTGSVTVEDPGSSWTSTLVNYIGYNGNGTLNIRNGGVVHDSRACYVGNGATSTSSLVVDGSGSILYANGGLFVGRSGANGTLKVAHGGTVNVKGGSIEINAGSSAVITVNHSNMVNANDSNGGSFVNNGAVRLVAQANLAADVYHPISVEPMPYGGPESWSGSGTYEAMGGTWNASAHTFTVSPALHTTAGTMISIALANNQRLTVGNDLDVCFAEGTATLNFTANQTSSETLAGLAGMLDDGEVVQGSWDFDIAGLPDHHKVMLAYAVNEDFSDLRIWHYDSVNGWSGYDGGDLTFDNGWAEFTVDSFSSYAVTAVPEPATLILFGIGSLMMWHRRKA